MIYRHLQRFCNRRMPYINRMDWVIVYFVSLMGGVALAATVMRCVGVIK